MNAARMGDPAVNSLGAGNIIGPGMPTVLIAGVPAAVMGDQAMINTLVGPTPDALIKGSMTVMIGGRPAIRMGDLTAAGGSVIMGAPTVMIGG